MEIQAHSELKAALDKLLKVRDAPTHGELEHAIVIDVVATLRTVLAMYTDTQSQEGIIEPQKRPFSVKDIFTGDR